MIGYAKIFVPHRASNNTKAVGLWIIRTDLFPAVLSFTFQSWNTKGDVWQIAIDRATDVAGIIVSDTSRLEVASFRPKLSAAVFSAKG